ncbi:MAG: methyltransferase domain-containing protein [Haliea sp.]
MENNKQTAHSEEYFGDYREHWWNPDFVHLMAARLEWAAAQHVLEVGSGAGHWARTIAPHLSSDARLSAIDSDPRWADSNIAWARSLAADGTEVAVTHGAAESIPFPDAEFDFVTCQTVLIHVADPSACIAEMLRVLKPGGLLVCVEPDNFGTCAAANSLSDASSLAADVAAFEFNLAQQRGRKALGLGDLSLGGLLPGMFAAAGLKQVQVHLSDKAIPLFPPYSTAEQRALLADTHLWFESAPDFSKAQAQQFFIAGGGDPAAFESHWSQELASRDSYLNAIREQDYHCAGGALMYLVSGRKC